MKHFYALLLIGIIAYVEGSHYCDKYAANVAPKAPNDDNEHEDQVIPLDEIFRLPRTKNVVTRVHTSSVSNSDSYCSAITHGNTCKEVGHSRLLSIRPDVKKGEGVNKLVLKTNYVAVTAKGYALKYEMTVTGADHDDYIFLGTINKVTKIYANGSEENIALNQIPESIRGRYTVEFALYHLGPNYALYMTCDAQAMWVTYDSDEVKNDKSILDSTAQELEKWIRKLQAKVQKEKPTSPVLTLPPKIDYEMDAIYDKHVLVEE